MSAIDTYNEKVLLVNNLENQLTNLNNRKSSIEANIANIDTEIAAKTTEKDDADTALVAAQANLPSDTTTYKTKLLECNTVDAALAQLNTSKTFMTGILSNIDQSITDVTAQKTTADTELAAALAALP